MGKKYEEDGNETGKVKYEKLSKRALHCMYMAGIIGGIVVFSEIGAGNAFWLFPQDIKGG